MMTTKGRQLSDKLIPLMGWTSEIGETCSNICRAATTLHRYQEYAANGQTHEWDKFAPRVGGQVDWKWVDERQAQDQEHIDAQIERLERLISRHVESLPQAEDPDTGERFTLQVSTGGDPRGCPVIILLPDELRRYSDDWGRTGICAPY